MEKKSVPLDTFKAVRKAFAGFTITESSKEKNVLKAALKDAQKTKAYKNQPVRLVELQQFLTDLKLSNGQMAAFLDTGFINAFMTANDNQVSYGEGGASGDSGWWAVVLKGLHKTCGLDAARTFCTLCDEWLVNELEATRGELGITRPPQARPSPSAPIERWPWLRRLVEDAQHCALQACLTALGETGPMDYRQRQKLLGERLDTHQQETVLNNQVLVRSVRALVAALDAQPTALNDTILALRSPITGGEQVSAAVVGVLMVFLMEKASRAQQLFDLPAFVAALAQADFPPAVMRSLVLAFAVLLPWTPAFKGQLLDSVEQRLCASEAAPAEKKLWENMVHEFLFVGKRIGWTPEQWEQLNRMNAYLQSASVGAMARPDAPKPGSGAPDASPMPMGLLLQSGLDAMKQVLGPFADRLHYDNVYARTAVGMVSAPAVQEAFRAVWEQRGESPGPLESALSAMDGKPRLDTALMLLGLLWSGLSAGPGTLNLQEFLPTVLRTLPDNFVTALAAVLVDGSPTPDQLTQAIDALVQLPETALLHGNQWEAWRHLLREVRFLADKAQRLTPQDRTKLHVAIDVATNSALLKV